MKLGILDRIDNMKITIEKINDNRIKVVMPYNLDYISKIKSISGYKWNQIEKYWSVPYTENNLRNLQKFFLMRKFRWNPR